MRTRVQSVALCALVGACGDPRPPATDSASSGLDPALFDCTAAGVPERASPVPISCSLDPTCRTPQVAAHRGAGGALGVLAPEDTLSAYRAGIAIGVEYVETDPRLSADGVLVNIHDDTVDRTTDGTGLVSSLTLAELQGLRIDAGAMRGDYSCERIPTLLEVLQTCRDRLVVLVDANKTDRVDLLIQTIHEADAREWVIFDSSSIAKIDEALALDPQLHVMIRPASTGEVTSQLDHLAPRVPVIVELEREDRAAASALAHARGTRTLSNVFVEDVLALDGPDPYGPIFDLGVDMVQSDRPDLVIEALRQRGAR